MTDDRRTGRARRLVVAAVAVAALMSPSLAAAETTQTNGLADAGSDAEALVAAAAAPPSGFEETVAFSGLTNPTAIRFAPDGRIFIAEKNGRIKVFDGLGDPTPTIFADLSNAVHDFWDRGLLGLALDPNFATRPYVYVLYAYNKDPNSATFPRWPDSCPSPPGATADGCVVTGRLSRLNAAGQEQVLIEDFCQQYPSHSVGSIAFGQDGALYLSAGDGASFDFTDYGQDGNPVNPCGDPPGGVGGSMSPPTAQGGALRSQDIRTTGDPTSLDGSILRVNPDTGAALPDNPNAGSADANARRIIAHGLRNPFRITIRPGTSEVWAGDVGWNSWEEINRVTSTSSTTNFGWPCYEGNGRQPSYDGLNLNLCESLYSAGASAIAAPYYTYSHSAKVVSGESCSSGSSSVAGLAFYPGGNFGTAYDGALFFADYSRNCIWAMLKGSNGLPDPARIQTFVAGAAGPVDLQFSPAGDLYYTDLGGGTIRRVRSLNANQAPTAVATGNPTSGAVPLTVNFVGSGSSDPNPGDTLSYAWDLDGDGAFDDSTAVNPSFTYTTAGVRNVRLRVTDGSSLSDTSDVITITAGTPPNVSIDAPAEGFKWKVNDRIAFSGSATDSQNTPLPATALDWKLNLEHCDDTGNCHTHPLETFSGVASGEFVAPNHEYPSHLELQLTATDANGLSRTVTRSLHPKTLVVTMESDPPGADLTIGSKTAATPFTREVIAGSTQTINAPSPQTLSGTSYSFTSWSDGGTQTHPVTVGETATTYKAQYERSSVVTLAGADVVGSNTSQALPGKAEVYRTTAASSGSATALRLYVDGTSTASELILGLYSDVGGKPTTLLSSGRVSNPVPGAWNEVAVSGPAITAGQVYWIGLLTPAGATGTLKWRDRAGGIGGAEQTSASTTLTGLPATWVKGRAYTDGPVSGYVLGTPDGPPPPPALSVSPSSLSFSATAGGSNPASKTLSVTNSGSGSLSFTGSSNVSWASVSPASGSAPRDVTVAIDTAGLSAGTYNGEVRIESAGVQGSPKIVPITLTLDPPAPPAMSVSPSSLSFTATAGGSNPAAKTLSVSNTGGGMLSFTASDAATWAALSPTSGTAPADVSVSVDIAGLSPGTYTTDVTVSSAGATGSPATVPVTLTVQPASTPPQGGLVGAWGFEEGSGSEARDVSGAGNHGTLSGPVRVPGKYGAALSFDGIDDWVTVPDAPSLDLTTASTLEAWVNPSALGTTWRTVVLKEQPSHLAYALYANNSATRPSGQLFTTSDFGLRGTAALPLNTWSHIAFTWDWLNMRFYVDGTLVRTVALTGTLVTTNNPLRFGGNAVWPEWFQGAIDEIRIYNRALSEVELRTDRDTPIGGV